MSIGRVFHRLKSTYRSASSLFRAAIESTIRNRDNAAAVKSGKLWREVNNYVDLPDDSGGEGRLDKGDRNNELAILFLSIRNNMVKVGGVVIVNALSGDIVYYGTGSRCITYFYCCEAKITSLNLVSTCWVTPIQVPLRLRDNLPALAQCIDNVRYAENAAHGLNHNTATLPTHRPTGISTSP
ncbi:hypothetical protein B0J17DRAFT_632983 [Rhizoctonia solani]|nr:hypothetical protein B0J17DRAFT_632983 [Rhizoctonia solani]